MKLIREEIESVDFLVEERNGKKSMYIEGVFLQGDIKIGRAHVRTPVTEKSRMPSSA